MRSKRPRKERAMPEQAAPHDNSSPEMLVAVPTGNARTNRLYTREEHHLTAGEAWRILVKSWPFISEQRRLVWLKCAVIIGSLLFYLAGPWPMKIIVDNVIDRRPLIGIPADILIPIVGASRSALLIAVTLFLIFTLALIGAVGDPPVRLDTAVGGRGLDQVGATTNAANAASSEWNGLFGYFETAITIDLTQRVNQAVRTAVYNRFLSAPLAVYTDQKIGDAVFRAMNDSASIGDLLYNGVVRPIASLVIFVCTTAILWAQFSNEPLIPIVAVLTLPVVAIGSGVFGRLFRDQNQRMRERGSDVMAAFEERLAQVQLIKAFGQEARETSKIDATSWSSYSATLKMLGLILLCAFVLIPLIALFLIAVVYHLMLEVIHGRITLGDVVLMLSYGGLLMTPMANIGSTWASLQGAVAGMRRVHSVLDRLGDDAKRSSNRVPLAPISYIEFRNVALGYDDNLVLHDVSMVLRSGEMAAIAGASGAGKTTIIYAIPRFIERRAGEILFDQRSSDTIATHDLRRRVGFVFQQESLFAASIADNIRYGVSSASFDAVKRAADAAGASEFIEQMQHGYDTMLGRRGARLSVGQKQGIAIARALLLNPEVLILDEPTAPLDSGNETALMTTLRALARDRIVLLVAHRADTLAACDRIYFVHESTIAACGTHDDLLATFPAYARYLAATQPEIQA
jgi:ABC-type multidrug transport system fused ATPase/permease subunit